MDNAITYKAQRDKNARELKLANAAITDMQMRQRDVAALDAKYTKELADAKAENDALRDDVAAGRRRLQYQSSLSVSAWSFTAASGVDNAALSDWQTICWTGLFHPQREADHYAKQLEGTQKYINEQQIERLYYGQLMQLLWAIHALPAEYKCLSNKTEQSIYECLLGFCFNNIFCAATNFIASIASPNSRNEEMMGDGFLWCYCCRFVLNSKRLLSTSCNKQGAKVVASSIFSWCYSRCFWSSQNRM